MKAWIAIAGNIGAGKTTLAGALGDELGWEVYEESSSPNPYLERFYQNMPRWAFHSQLHFMVNAIQSAQQISERGSGAVQDRSLYEHYHVFARDLHSQGIISADEWETLGGLYYAVDDLVPAPDLLVYLDAPVEMLADRIKRSPREYEQGIDPTYLRRLDERYRSMLDIWTRSPVVTIPADRYDMRSETDVDGAVEEILRAVSPVGASTDR